MGYSVVWFKRDLRLHDHAALHHACQQGPVLCLYVIEPSLWAQPDAATQHYTFIAESLRDLRRSIQQLGGQLHVVCGEVPDVLARLHAAMPMAALYSHEETGNGATFERDKAVARWAKNHGVPWHQPPQFGVVRRLPSRDDWQPCTANPGPMLCKASPPCKPCPHPTNWAYTKATHPSASAGAGRLRCKCCTAFCTTAVRSTGAVFRRPCRRPLRARVCRPTSPTVV
jgi:deoxyribodipyrimidine photo-lyase